MEDLGRKKRRHTLEDFATEKVKDQNGSRIATKGNVDNDRLNHETNPTSTPTLQEIASLIRIEVEKAMNDLKTQIVPGDPKSRSKKKRDPIYILNEDYPTVLEFRKNNEPLKETLRRVIRAAGRYLQMTGDSEVQ